MSDLQERIKQYKQGAPEGSTEFERWMIDSNSTLHAKVEPIYKEWDFKAQRKESLRKTMRDLRLYLGVVAAVMGIVVLVLGWM